ncbi:hypothetical protein AVEN_220604-1 [Araneus ventricosus]|uniref:Uncharacterized protein n=1 Tax=Araneus ventricosus TaxID=182803 RepID=A0A4Y2K5Y7_ARAVE|nr:hypothetical protein AVEN_254901-1 [Araneus ventricosus]GBM97685.1 hypothetical protein AVEN_220604-1 [Araneus ventricosus]
MDIGFVQGKSDNFPSIDSYNDGKETGHKTLPRKLSHKKSCSYLPLNAFSNRNKDLYYTTIDFAFGKTCRFSKASSSNKLKRALEHSEKTLRFLSHKKE